LEPSRCVAIRLGKETSDIRLVGNTIRGFKEEVQRER